MKFTTLLKKKLVPAIVGFAAIAAISAFGTAYADTGLLGSELIDTNKVEIVNNVGKSDRIYIYGLSPKETIKVYADETSARVLAKKTLGKTATSVTLSVAQLGISEGSIYITSTTPGCAESDRVEVNFDGEPVSERLTEADITIDNLAGTKDVILVEDLVAGDLITVYRDVNKSKKYTSGRATSSRSYVKMTYSQLGADGGVVYISITTKGMRESDLLAVEFAPEEKTAAISEGNIEITNNKSSSDKIYICNVEYGDTITVYNPNNTSRKMLTVKCAKNKDEITKAITGLSKDGGHVYVTVTHTGKQESEMVMISYDAEQVTAALDANQITVTNNPKGTTDVIEVEDIEGSSIVKIYKDEKTTASLKTATCSSSGSSVSVKISQIGADEGTLWFTLTESGKHESERVPFVYAAEEISESIDLSGVAVTNNHGNSDIIRVSGLEEGDIVSVYKTATVKSTVAKKTITDSASVNITIAQLGTSAGTVYLTLTQSGKCESERIAVDFPAEGKSTAPASEKITVTNNLGKASVLKITGLFEDDTVNVYKLATDTEAFATGTVATYFDEAELSLSSLSANGGTLYVSVKSKNLKESDFVEITYGAQQSSDAVKSGKVTIENNADTSDTVTVSERDSGDIVYVYNQETDGKLLGSATVASSSTKAVITVTQLGEDGGTVYISAKSSGLKESARVAVTFEAEKQTDAIAAGNVEIVNYADKADTITVYSLLPGNTVKIYTSLTEETPVVTASVPTSGASVTASVSQLGTDEGSVFITVTKSGRKESARTEVSYAAESTALKAADITVTNNASISDTIKVSGLASGDVVTVYETSSTTTVLATGSASSDGTVSFSVAQLGTNAGSLYISVTNKNRAESSRTKADYLAEQSTNPLFIGQIVIVNNDSDVAVDTITVTELTAYDTIRVYDLAGDGSLLGTGSVGAGKDSVTISVKQLGEDAGRVFISITSYGKTESVRLGVDFVAE